MESEKNCFRHVLRILKNRPRMDLELVCKILCESCRLLWAQTVSRFRARFVWKGQAFVQVVRTRPTFINNTEVSSTADTVTSIGCPGIQAYTSANTEPGATLPKMLVFPQISLQDIIAMPDSTMPIFSIILPFYNCVLHYSNSLKVRRCHLLLTHGIAAYRIISYFSPFRC